MALPLIRHNGTLAGGKREGNKTGGNALCNICLKKRFCRESLYIFLHPLHLGGVITCKNKAKGTQTELGCLSIHHWLPYDFQNNNSFQRRFPSVEQSCNFFLRVGPNWPHYTGGEMYGEVLLGWGGLKPWDVTYWYYIISLGKPKKGLNAEDYTVKYLLRWQSSSIHLTNYNMINWCRFMHSSTEILLQRIYYLLAVVFVSQFILSSSKIHLTGNASI